MICGSLSAFVPSGLSGLSVSIGVFSCSVFWSDSSVSMVAGLVSRTTVDLRIREYCWYYATKKQEICCMWMAWSIIVSNTAANARQYNVSIYIIHRSVSVISATTIRVLFRNTNKNTNNSFVFLYNTLIMVAEAIETCRWIIYDKTCFIDGFFWFII